MPLRPLNRDQTWMLPPTLDVLLPDDHPARFVAEFVDGLDRTQWAEMGVGLDGNPRGAPAYHPRALLSVWLYGFMTGMRSCRKLEGACRDQIPYLWLTGWQHPDHNTLWRFYRAHRGSMRTLMKCSVGTAVEMGLVDLAVQAVDGTKIQGNASRNRTYDARGLQKLLDRTEAAIAELEAQNERGNDPPPPKLPELLNRARGLRDQVRAAMERLVNETGVVRVNLTDGDSELMKGRNGIVAGYNAQSVVSPVNPALGTGMLITAADVGNNASDSAQLIPMLEMSEGMTGVHIPVTLADGGYHTAANLGEGERRGDTLVMTERYHPGVQGPYFKDRFVHDPAMDRYLCPEGQWLQYRGLRKANGRIEGPFRVYRAPRAVCRACPAFGACTKDKHVGRALWIGPHDRLIRKHRQWMATEQAQRLYDRRKGLIEPVFGILKEQMAGRRFLLRGISNVSAEFVLLATAFNLRTLWRCRSSRSSPGPNPPTVAAPVTA